MKATVHINGHEHQQVYGAAMKAGLERHGITVTVAGGNDPRPGDFAVVWGWKQVDVIKAAPHVLVMERGYLDDRMTMTSCGWDGLARRGRYPRAADGGARWRARYAEAMQPWTDRAGYALVIGQVDGDAALGGLDMASWRVETERELGRLGWWTVFRPHPVVARSRRSLADDLRGAGLCVTYSSTTGVQAVLAGVPTVTLDPGAMAWPVSSHRLGDPAHRPDRDAWAHDLAWAQWSLAEIANGDTWAHLGGLMSEAV